MAGTSSSNRNLERGQKKGDLDGSSLRIGIVVSRWNTDITFGMLDGALAALRECGVPTERMHVIEVPGAFEIPVAARKLADRGLCDAIVALGCVVKGETAHFEYVSEAAMHGIREVALQYGVPVTCGVLTTYTMEQAITRSRDNADNKGREAALAAVETATLLRTI